jgi:hypothetical protein
MPLFEASDQEPGNNCRKKPQWRRSSHFAKKGAAAEISAEKKE